MVVVAHCGKRLSRPCWYISACITYASFCVACRMHIKAHQHTHDAVQCLLPFVCFLVITFAGTCAGVPCCQIILPYATFDMEVVHCHAHALSVLRSDPLTLLRACTCMLKRNLDRRILIAVSHLGVPCSLVRLVTLRSWLGRVVLCSCRLRLPIGL